MNFQASSTRKRWLELGGNGSVNGGDDAGTDSLASRRKRQNAQPADAAERRRKFLVVRGCLGKVQLIGSSLGYSQNLRLTAMAYIRRYFEVEPLQGNDLAVTILTAYYLAGKVEEELGKGMSLDKRGVYMKDLCDFVKSKKRSLEEFKNAAILNEMKLLVGLNFDLLCFHPLRSALALLDELKDRVTEEKQFDGLKKAIAIRCEGCYLVDDLVFKHPHSFLGAVVVHSAIKNSSFSDTLKQELLKELKHRVEQLAGGKETTSEQIRVVAEILDQGLAAGKAKEADDAYMDYIKRGTLSPPS